VEAPLNEVLAAGIILMTGWRGETDFIDPMCGSGTLPIEATLIARNMAPGLFRKGYAFEKWSDFDAELFENIYNDDSQERPFEHHVYGYDNNRKAVEIATNNVKAAGLTGDITIQFQDFKDFTQPAEKSIMVTNPPYGERIKPEDLLGLYKMIGGQFKHQFVDNEAWVLSYREECFDAIGLKASLKVPLYNGALECEVRKYQMFSGRYNEVRSEGRQIKSDDDRRQMSQKRRFKENRAVKQRLDETDEEFALRQRRPRRNDDERDGRRRDFHRGERGERGERRERRGDFGDRDRRGDFGDRRAGDRRQRRDDDRRQGGFKRGDRDFKPRDNRNGKGRRYED